MIVVENIQICPDIAALLNFSFPTFRYHVNKLMNAGVKNDFRSGEEVNHFSVEIFKHNSCPIGRVLVQILASHDMVILTYISLALLN